MVASQFIFSATDLRPTPGFPMNHFLAEKASKKAAKCKWTHWIPGASIEAAWSSWASPAFCPASWYSCEDWAVSKVAVGAFLRWPGQWVPISPTSQPPSKCEPVLVSAIFLKLDSMYGHPVDFLGSHAFLSDSKACVLPSSLHTDFSWMGGKCSNYRATDTHIWIRLAEGMPAQFIFITKPIRPSTD